MLSMIQITPGMDLSTMAAALSENFKQIESENRTKIIKDENGNERIILGRYSNGKYGMKVSPAGINVQDATDDELIFNSDNNIFKIVQKGTTTLASPNSIGSSTFVNVPFTLGTKPIVFAFVAFSAGGTRFPMPYIEPIIIGANAGKVSHQVAYEVITDNITFFWRDITVATNLTAHITYYILQETAD